MNIVVLDGYTLNPGDLSWRKLEDLGTLKVYDRTPIDTSSVVAAIGDAEIVFTNKTPLPREVLQQVGHVRYIGVLATGFNVVDTQAAKAMGMVVTNVPTYGTQTVAQMTLALLLEMCHHVGEHNRAVHAGDWIKSEDFCFWNYPLVELEGKTMGLVGFGQIGRATARLARTFGMRIITTGSRSLPEPEGCAYVSLDELLAQSDVISMHCPLTDQTEGIINKNSIAKMKDGVMFINTSRGGLVVEEDLKEALLDQKISFAAVDVVSQEPMKSDNPLLGVENCIITPHIAWASKAARSRLLQTALDNLNAFLKGNPVNVVKA
ncbi:D-2-hydroxyacid dehydrogenase [Pseudozobellia thermophila]|uniref:Glycerate dehydrogenase n=1 Tax=Pseudozobellia thermophila TaxID=192903 RepID=A0A1M6I4J5_9FLAO|nr:D-2-hydroxyacid dehydrogenase [Pseudozobellia thermophila]SHJ29339.1 glycerate dehydrogenase [Pseudozobellia thermophila]